MANSFCMALYNQLRNVCAVFISRRLRKFAQRICGISVICGKQLSLKIQKAPEGALCILSINRNYRTISFEVTDSLRVLVAFIKYIPLLNPSV